MHTIGAMPPRRETAIAHSVQYSLTHNDRKPTLLGSVPGYFHVYWLTFECVREDLFKALRGTWQMEQNEYLKSFTGKKALVPMVHHSIHFSTCGDADKTAGRHGLLRLYLLHEFGQPLPRQVCPAQLRA